MKSLQQMAVEWDKQFTFKANELTGDDALARVAAAWLAGYQACRRNASARRRRRSKADRGTK